MNKIRKDDEVVVIIGKDRGRRGKVTAVRADSVVVEGINVAKKHQKPNPQAGVTGGVIEKEMPIAISNVAIWNPRKGKDGGADRVGFKFVGEGEKRRKVRVFRSNGESLEG